MLIDGSEIMWVGCSWYESYQRRYLEEGLMVGRAGRYQDGQLREQHERVIRTGRRVELKFGQVFREEQ